MNKSKLGAKNVIWGIVAQIVTIGLGVLIPRLVLVNLGSEANGLLSSVGSVLSYLSLLEAGVGTATVQALYKPYVENDRDSINSILSATHHYYKRTGLVYLAIVIAVSIFYTAFIETGLPRISVFLVIILSGLSGVLSYFFQGKYRLLLTVEGKGYILTNIATVTTVCVSLTKAMVLLAGGDVVMVQLVYFVYNLAQVVFFVCYIRKHYQWLDLDVSPNFEAISQKNAVLVNQIASLVFYHTDAVILTLLTSLKVVSVYSMYAMIFGMVKSIVVVFTDSFIFALGQAYVDRERFLRMHNAYETFTISFAFSMYCITGILVIPFMKLYTRGVTDINYIDAIVAGLFLAYYLMDVGRKPSGILINIAQQFEQTKWRAVLEAIINLTASVALTSRYGIYGVLLGTVIALLYRANDMILYAAKLLERSPWITYRRWGRNLLLFLVFQLIAPHLPIQIDNYVSFFLWGAMLSIVIISCFLLINSLREPESAHYAFEVMKNMLRRGRKAGSA